MQAGRKSSGRTIEVYDVLPPTPSARREPARPSRPVLVEDAVFEVVGPAQPQRERTQSRREHNDNPARPLGGRRIDIARMAAVAGVYLVNRLERLLSGLSTQSFVTLIASLFFLVFWFCGGFSAIASRPVEKPASPFVIEKVFTEALDENGMRLLAVGGILRNHADTTLAVPPLSVVGEGGEVIGAIVPAAPELAAGQSVRFFSRFQLAGGKSGTVTIFPAAE